MLRDKARGVAEGGRGEKGEEKTVRTLGLEVGKALRKGSHLGCEVGPPLGAKGGIWGIGGGEERGHPEGFFLV